MSVFGVGAILGGYLGGKLTDRMGFFRVQFFSLLCNGILFIVLGYMNTLTSIAICVFAMSSLGEAFRPANAAAIAAYSTPQNRTRCYSLNRLAINLGWAVGPAIGGILAGINFHLLFWVDGITCIIAAVLLQLFLGEEPTSQKASAAPHIGPMSSPLRDKSYTQMLLFLLLAVIAFFQIFSIVPVYFRDEMHLTPTVIGWLLAANGLIIALVEMVMVYNLEHKRPNTFYMIMGAFLIGASYLMLVFKAYMAMILLSIVTITFGEMLLFPFVNSFWVSRTNPHNRGSYAALFTMTFALANVLAPVIGANIALHKGYSVLFTGDFILCLLASFGFLWLHKRTISNAGVSATITDPVV